MLSNDSQSRQAALDSTRSFIVEAPAGSGKTALLIQRFLALLAQPAVETPAQVLAITFTRKATAEMRDRIWQQLSAASNPTEPSEPYAQLTRQLAQQVLAKDHALAWNLLANPNALNIRTIDSVCAEIARQLPILTGAGAPLTPTEDAHPLHAEAARRTLMLLGGPDSALTQSLQLILLHRDGNLANCESLIAEMLATRDQWGELVPLTNLTDLTLDTIALPRLDRALDRAICRVLTRLTQILPPAILAQLSALAAEMAQAEGYKGAPSPIALCRNRNQSPIDRAEDLDHWRALIHLLVKPSKPRDFRKSLSGNHIGFEILKHHHADLKQIISQLAGTPNLLDDLCRIDALPPAQYPRDQWPIAKALFRILSRALVELQFVFTAQNTCDFTESALQAKSALRTDGALNALRTANGTTLQHLLVDEMQDTSSSQYELIQLLTASFDGHSQTVFLVGDPKQSIYLFRQARVERFVHTLHKKQLGDVPLTPLALTANFRSQRTLVEDFNTTFTALFPSDLDPTRPEIVPYTPAVPTRPPGSPATQNEGQTWHTAILPYADDKLLCQTMARTQTQSEAQEIRTIAQTWLAKSLPPGRTAPWKLAVLVRNRAHLTEIVAAFQQSPSIPYRALKIEPLGERREILDLLALTRALLHPADRTSWLALLRTPWAALTLADLHLIAGDPATSQTPILTLLETHGDLLPSASIARLEPFYQVITAALAQRTRLPLARWIERTWRSFQAAEFATEEELTNANRFFALLAQLETTQGTLDLPTLETQLADLHALPAPHPSGAVDLVTIHGAKGLEWDVVFVPALHRKGRNPTTKLVSWLETDAGPDLQGQTLADPDIAHGILAPIQSKGTAATQLKKWMDGIESNRESAERTRLLYVACTRAREELHLFATLTRKKAGDYAPPPNSLLAAAWPAAEEHFAPQQTLPLLQLPQPTFALAAAAAPTYLQHLPQLPPQTVPPPIWVPQVSPLRPGLDHHQSSGDSHRNSSDELQPSNTHQPQGNYLNRTFGNTLHAFLQLLTQRIAQGQSPDALLTELPTWPPRITAVLRAAAAPPTLTAAILRGLTQTLESPEGRWLLAPHPTAATESAYTAANSETTQTIRLDRTFLAGPTPGTTGTTHLWIIDYKTATHAQEGVTQFLTDEEKKYRPRLENYATQLLQSTPQTPIRIALFYPMLPTLHLL